MPQTHTNIPNHTVYGDRVRAANDVVQAQINLMTAVALLKSQDELVTLTDELRLCIAKLNATPDRDYKSGNKDSMLQDIQDAMLYVEATQKIQANNALITEWIKTDPRSGLSDDDRIIEKSIALDTDPRFDIVVVNDDENPTITDRLRSRGYARVIPGSVARAALNIDNKDEDALKKILCELPFANTMFPQEARFVGYKDREQTQQLGTAISERIQNQFLTRATVGRYLRRWFLQLIENFPVIFERGISRSGIEAICAGHGALVVGSGPSLDVSIEHIKKMVRRPIVICALSALKALYRNHIIPDFVVVLDPQQPVSHLDGVDTSLIKAFYVEYSMNPALMQAIKTQIIPYGAGSDVHDLLSKWEITSMPFFLTGGSVIHPAFDLAIKLGCTEIGFVGMDLGFVDNRIYASDTVDGHKFKISDDQRSYSKAQVNEYGENGIVVAVRANNGGMVKTSVPLNQYRMWLENAIKHARQVNEAIQITNFSANGATIAGAPYLPMSSYEFRAIESTSLEQSFLSAPAALDANSQATLQSRITLGRENLELVRHACQQALANNLQPEYVSTMAKHTGDSEELTMFLAEDLLELEDLLSRGNIDHKAKLVDLVKKTEQACDEILKAYGVLANYLHATN
jgi:Protein of unknown function DUF115